MQSYAVNRTKKLILYNGLWHHSCVVAGDITTQSKQGQQAMPVSIQSILCCLCILHK